MSNITIDVKNDDMLGRMNDGVIATKLYSLEKALEEKDKEIERLKEELKYTIPIVEHNKTITKHLKEIERLNNIIKEVREYIDNLKPLTKVETSIKEELKSAYNPKESAIKGTEEYFNAVCHLEDFEIAIWNIKKILDKEKK